MVFGSKKLFVRVKVTHPIEVKNSICILEFSEVPAGQG